MYAPTDADFDVLVGLARAHGIDPIDVALELYFESAGFNPASARVFPTGLGVYGLNQMATANLDDLGLTPAAWTAMSAAEQLPHVFDFWAGLAKGFNQGRFPTTLGQLEGLNFLPKSFKDAGAGDDAGAVLAGVNGPYAANFSDNRILAHGTDVITPATIDAALRTQARAWGPRWTVTMLGGLAAAEARGGAATVPPPVRLPPITITGPALPPAPRNSGAGELVALGVVAALAAKILRGG